MARNRKKFGESMSMLVRGSICAPAGLKLEPAATASSDIPEHDLKTSLRNIFSNIDSQRASYFELLQLEILEMFVLRRTHS